MEPFFIIGAVLIVIAAVVLFLYFKKKNRSSIAGIDSAIGETCVVTERVDNISGCGEAKVKGMIWAARSVSDDQTFDVGDTVYVMAIEGVKLVLRKL